MPNKAWTILLALLEVTGCTVAERTYVNGEAEHSLSFFQGGSADCNHSDLFAEEIISLGFWLGAENSGIGFKKSRRVCGIRDCQLVLWPSPDFDVNEFEEKFGPLDEICSKSRG